MKSPPAPVKITYRYAFVIKTETVKLGPQVNLEGTVLERFKNDLRYFFIVSAVEVKKGAGNGDAAVAVQVGKAPGLKCERCWNFSTHVGEDKNYPTVCERCSAVLKEIVEA